MAARMASRPWTGASLVLLVLALVVGLATAYPSVCFEDALKSSTNGYSGQTQSITLANPQLEYQEVCFIQPQTSGSLFLNTQGNNVGGVLTFLLNGERKNVTATVSRLIKTIDGNSQDVEAFYISDGLGWGWLLVTFGSSQWFSPSGTYGTSSENTLPPLNQYLQETIAYQPTVAPTINTNPTPAPTARPTTQSPTIAPTRRPSPDPWTTPPTGVPTNAPPTGVPTNAPSVLPTTHPTAAPSSQPTNAPSALPTTSPSIAPSLSPSASPTLSPTFSPTPVPIGDAVRYGNTSNELGWAIDSFCNDLYSCGRFQSTVVTIGDNVLVNANQTGLTYDGMCYKMNITGHVEWAFRAGGGEDDNIRSVAVDPVNGAFVYACGFYESPSITFGNVTLTNAGTWDAFVVKVDATDGSTFWAYNVGGTKSDFLLGIACDAAGSAYTVGYSNSPSITLNNGVTITITDPAGLDIIIIKYDTNGIAQWGKDFGSGWTDDYAYSVALDNFGFLYVTGAFYSSTLDFGNGNILTRWGTLVKTDAWTAKFDAATGNSVWAVDIGGPDNDDFGFDIAVEPSTGDSISTGNFIAATLHVGPSYSVNKTGPVGYNNAFVVRLSSTGSVEFVEQFGGPGAALASATANSVDFYPSGRYVVTVAYTGTVDFKLENATSAGAQDAATLYFDQNNDLYSVQTFGGPNHDYATSITVDQQGCNDMSYQTGAFSSPVLEVSGSTLVNAGPTSTSDIFVAGFEDPYQAPTGMPTAAPSMAPTAIPTTTAPTAIPTPSPTGLPTVVPTAIPTLTPTGHPTAVPTVVPTKSPSVVPSSAPSDTPTGAPSPYPTVPIGPVGPQGLDPVPGTCPLLWTSITTSSNGSLLIATESGGNIHTSSDGGYTWVPRSSPGAQSWTGCAISGDGSRAVAVADGGGVWTSSDGGATWVQQTSGLPPSGAWTAVTISQDGSTTYATDGTGSVYSSLNGGASWMVLPSPPAPSSPQAWSAISTSADGSVVIASVNGGPVYMSFNGGQTWTEQQYLGAGTWTAAAVSADGLRAVATDAGTGILWAYYAGVWVAQTGTGLRNWSAVAISADGLTIVAGEWGGPLYVSKTDAGTTWIRDTSAGNQNWQGIALDGSGRSGAAVVNGGCIYRINKPDPTSAPTTAPTGVTQQPTIAPSANPTISTISPTAAPTAAGFTPLEFTALGYACQPEVAITSVISYDPAACQEACRKLLNPSYVTYYANLYRPVAAAAWLCSCALTCPIAVPVPDGRVYGTLPGPASITDCTGTPGNSPGSSAIGNTGINMAVYSTTSARKRSAKKRAQQKKKAALLVKLTNELPKRPKATAANRSREVALEILLPSTLQYKASFIKPLRRRCCGPLSAPYYVNRTNSVVWVGDLPAGKNAFLTVLATKANATKRIHLKRRHNKIKGGSGGGGSAAESSFNVYYSNLVNVNGTIMSSCSQVVSP